MAVPSAAEILPPALNDEHQKQYCSRKPKWWTQLSGRRGTKGQRQAIQRMTHRGYCFSKDVLTDFSRVNNRARQNNNRNRAAAATVNNENGKTRSAQKSEEVTNCSSSGCYDDDNDAWRRAWWDGALGIAGSGEEDNSESTTCAMNMNKAGIDDNTLTNNGRSEKYAHKMQQMYNYQNPLPPNKFKREWLEIGFGNGDNLLANAKNHPEDLFIGCEVHQPGVGTVLRQMETELGMDATDCNEGTRGVVPMADGNDDLNDISRGGAKNGNGTSGISNDDVTPPHSPSSRKPSPCQNIRILPGDGIKLLSHLPTNYLDVVLVTFPDPWPRECHFQWRVVQREVVREMHRVLKPFGRVYVATDAECFDVWTREKFQQESSSTLSCDLIDGDGGDGATAVHLWNEIIPCPNRASWLPVVSYYEQKGLDEGRSTILQCWQRL